MGWIKKQLGVILTAATLLAAVCVSYGGLSAQQDALETRQLETRQQLQGKADKEGIVRELDLLHRRLDAIDKKLDEALLRGAR